MTLTLDEVKSIRFPMAKRPNEGYRASEVDNFVDKVELAFSQLTQERDELAQQVETLKASGGDAAEPVQNEADSQLKKELEEARKQASAKDAEIQKLRGEIEQARTSAKEAAAKDGDQRVAKLTDEVTRARSDNDQLRSQLAGRDKELNSLRGELDQARQAAAQAQAAQAQAAQAQPQPVAAPTVVDGVQKLEVSTSAEASPAVVRLVQLATEQAESVVTEAQNEANRKLEEANKRAHELTSSAQSRADQIVGEAQIRAERLTSEAQISATKTTRDANAEADRLVGDAKAHSEKLYKDTEDRRRELFTQLESDRDTLAGKVTRLRDFESNFRGTLSQKLEAMLGELKGGTYEPGDKPAVLDELGQSSTPRLDALLAEHHQQ